MMKYFLDAGTTWSKILKTDGENKEYSLIRTSELKNLDIEFEIATGHTGKTVRAKSYENEVVALSYGAKVYQNAIILDLGSRDAKWVKFKDGKFQDMDWNTSCASATGATIEMLLKFYNADISKLKPVKEKYTVTCGIFGMEKIMDDISKGESAEVAISKFITGIAYNAYNFTKKPEKIFLSGGFCENKCFLEALNFYTQVEPIGRFALVDGLYNIFSQNQNKKRSLENLTLCD